MVNLPTLAYYYRKSTNPTEDAAALANPSSVSDWILDADGKVALADGTYHFASSGPYSARTVTVVPSFVLTEEGGDVTLSGPAIPSGGVLKLTITAPAAYAGAYSIDLETLSNGPVVVVEPTTAATTGNGSQVDDVLTVTPGLYAHAPNVLPIIVHQWLRDGQPIDGAVGESYTLTADDMLAELAVRETILHPLGEASTEVVARDAPPILKFGFNGVDQYIRPGALLTNGPEFTFAGRFTMTDEFADQTSFFGRFNWELFIDTINGGRMLFRMQGTSGSRKDLFCRASGDLRGVPELAVIASARAAGFADGSRMKVWINGVVERSSASLDGDALQLGGSWIMARAYGTAPTGARVHQWLWISHENGLDPDDPEVASALFDAGNGYAARVLPADGAVLGGVRPTLFLNGAKSFLSGENFGTLGGTVTLNGPALEVSL